MTDPTRDEAVTDTCDQGHRFAKLPDHPTRDGRPRCPHCLAMGLDAARAAASPRNEAVPTGWQLVPVEPTFDMRIAGSNVHDQRPSEVVSIYRTMLDSAPAPASGGVDAVREALLGYVLKPGQYETASAFARGQNRVAVDMLGVLDEASLSPAATPGLTMPSREWMRDKIAADPDVEDCGAVPAATPVSEGVSPYDDAVQGDEMLMKMLNAAVEENIRLRAALAKPASSPAGGDVLREALQSIAEHTDPEGIDNYRSDDREGCLDTVHAIASRALSPSTSAGRVGE